MKKILSVVLICAIAIPLLTLTVSAQETAERRAIKSMVVFGDSISTGYGLDGSYDTRASYANLVAQALGLNYGNGYANYAVDGYTSEDIYKMAQFQSASVATADLILVTCGGNDILRHALSIAASAAGLNTDNLIQIAIAILQMMPEDLSAALHSEENEKIIREALTVYRSNMELLVAYLRTNAPDARIVFLTQYNPISGVPILTALDAYGEEVIGRLNEIMVEVVVNGGCEIVDTHAVMVKRGLELSNIMSSDIHPNAAGHAEMAKMVKAHLGIVEVGESTTILPPETTAEPVMTTTLPEITTTEPIVTTTLPEITTTEPIVTTTLPATVTSDTTVGTTTVVTEPTVSDSVILTEIPTTGTSEEIPADAPGEKEPSQETSSKGVLIVGAALLSVGIAGTAIAIVKHKK